ncbi:MAG: adenylate/guanylate cyclase domain-containing protein [Candidatus Promineifilaceae bacterium]|nr:adenylate/guanylate cyclase domain-containing protein [Candidatus Promineifilaceae bacterium]
MNKSVNREPTIEEVWRSYLTTGTTPAGIKMPWYEWRSMRAVARRLPSDPRCRQCYYPFTGLGGALVRSLFRLEPSKLNPHFCNICERFAEAHPGGVELETSLLFADIRGSTPLAETMNAYDFSQLIDRFYQVTTNIIYKYGGMVEKLVGDEVTAFFVPAFVENGNHARAAVLAGREILTATGHGQKGNPWAPLGIGIHTGEAYVGAVGEPGKNISIAVLGDNVNIAARLTSQAKMGEMILSHDTLRISEMDNERFESRSLTLKGKEMPVDVWIYQAKHSHQT